MRAAIAAPHRQVVRFFLGLCRKGAKGVFVQWDAIACISWKTAGPCSDDNMSHTN
jgi:hypothetical protein